MHWKTKSIVLTKKVGQDQDEYRKLSKEEMSTKLNVLEDKFNCLAKKVGQDQDEYRKLSNEEMSTKLNALDKISCLAKEVEHLNKRAPEPRILKHAVWLNEPTDSSKLTRPVLEEEKCLGFREILKQTNERCRPK
nr:uncharacterized protein LOC124817063 [Hydra vulgaris]